jgi:tRNA G10  N-methylase Trm11
LQKELGGVIKILKVIDVVKKRDRDSINFSLQHYFKPSKIKNDFLKNYTGKIQFGVSVYLLDMETKAFGEPKRLGMFIKRSMQDAGKSIRLVVPEFNSLALASVVVTKNLLLSKGAEICVLADKEKVYVAKTLTVQDFEDYGRRDYQRPVRDEKQGMIPPKVAQSMLNLAACKLNQTILDPFCGGGTIVQEGVLLGFKMLGSDVSKSAIAGSEKNLEWFRNRYKVSKGRYHVEVCDAQEISGLVERLKSVKAVSSIDAIVTEGYLGPMYGKFPKESEIEQNFKDLQKLYTNAFKEFLKILSNKSKVVICFPAYKKNQTDYIKFSTLLLTRPLYSIV